MTALVWYRRDLRVHDHPPLHLALRDHAEVVPVFVLDPRLLDGRFPSANRAAFLFGALTELRESLRARGGELVVRTGEPERVLVELARETGATEVRFASDVSPFAHGRDRRVEEALRSAGIRPRRSGGNFVADTREEKPYKVFSAFHRRWEARPRRSVHPAPSSVPVPSGLDAGELPRPDRELHHVPGEAAGRKRLEAWLRSGVEGYVGGQNQIATGTSELSMYLHFGCVSAREAEEKAIAVGGMGAAKWRRQLAWRDFYGHVLYHHPSNAHHAMKAEPDWDSDDELLEAWKAGRTGYPIVDAGMRQLTETGFMHNRARLIVGSFLTKDLHLDWRLGEAHFMAHLLDGDEAQNNGNWQWIASTGVDPAPFFKRLYNPVLQQERHDPDGIYVRRWLPELRDVPTEQIAEPWKQPILGLDYPEPIVDHAQERQVAIAAYKAAV